MLSLHSVIEKKKKDKKSSTNQCIFKEKVLGFVIIPGENSFCPTPREYMVSFAGSKPYQIKMGFYFRQCISDRKFYLATQCQFQCRFLQRWQDGVFYINHGVCYWYCDMFFHLLPVVLALQLYCGLLICNCICFSPAVHLITKILFSIFCR